MMGAQNKHVEHKKNNSPKTLKSKLMKRYPRLKNLSQKKKTTFLTKALSYTAAPRKLHKDFRCLVFAPLKSEYRVTNLTEYNENFHTKALRNLPDFELMQILHGKLLKHKWGDVAMILQLIAKMRCRSQLRQFHYSGQQPEMLQRIGKEVLYNHAHGLKDERLLQAYHKSLALFGVAIDISQVSIEDAFYHFAKHDYATAKESLEEYDKFLKYSQVKEKRRAIASTWTDVVSGYYGIADYCTWRKMTAEDGGSSSFLLSCSSTSVASTKQVSIASAAIEHITKVLEKQGVWDIFVLKLIEILLHHYKFDLLQENLLLYSDNHGENPNAHRYLYSFLNSYVHEDKKEKSIKNIKKKALKRLHEVSPADSLMVNFHNMLTKDALSVEQGDGNLETNVDAFCESLEVAMNLLDHPCSSMSEEPWICLSKNLFSIQTVLDQASFAKVIEKLWIDSGRSSWWPRFHFTSAQALKIARCNNAKLIQAKVEVASIFLKDSCEFCETVKMHCKSI